MLLSRLSDINHNQPKEKNSCDLDPDEFRDANHTLTPINITAGHSFCSNLLKLHLKFVIEADFYKD